MSWTVSSFVLSRRHPLFSVYEFSCFFISSRRRHTRCALVTGVQTCALPIFLQLRNAPHMITAADAGAANRKAHLLPKTRLRINAGREGQCIKIGRASCRERVCQYV